MGFLKLLAGDVERQPKLDISTWMGMEYNDISFILSKSVYMYRQENNLSQKDLADILGCKKNFIIRLEAGEIDDISIRLLIELWTKLSTKDFNFGDYLLTNIHNIVNRNYEQLNLRR